MIVGTLIKWAIIGIVILAVIGIVIWVLNYYGYIGSDDNSSSFTSGEGILESILPVVWRKRASGGPDIPVWT